MLWIKALHVIAVVSWMAGLLYLPRLFVYHMQAPVGGVQSETFKVMERRLLKAIMGPAMMVAWVCGLLLVFWFGTVSFSDGWFGAKFALVVGLTVFHVHLSRCVRLFSTDERPFSERYFRLINEIPTVLMIVIVILVIVRPF